MTPEAMRARLVQRLEENRGLAPEVAAWAVDTWSYALGVGLARTSDRVEDIPATILPSVHPSGLSVAERVASDRAVSSVPVLDPAPPPRPSNQKRAGIAAVLALALAAGGFALWHKPVPPPPPPPVPVHNGNGDKTPGGSPGGNNGGNSGTNKGGNSGTNNGGNTGTNSGTTGTNGTGSGSNQGNNNGSGTHSGSSGGNTGGNSSTSMNGATASTLRIPAGTLVSVRLDRPVNSEEVASGDVLEATVSSPIVINGDVVVATGARAHLRVTSVDASGQNDGAEHLSLSLADVESERGRVHVIAPAKSFNGPAKKADAAKRAGFGAAAGAVGGFVVGHLFHHGGAGAAAGAGGGAVTGAVTAKAGPVKLPSETLLHFHLAQPASIGSGAAR